jgi:hypothetical protein
MHMFGRDIENYTRSKFYSYRLLKKIKDLNLFLESHWWKKSLKLVLSQMNNVEKYEQYEQYRKYYVRKIINICIRSSYYHIFCKRNKEWDNPQLMSHGKLPVIGRLPRPDIVHFRSACRGTEIFLRELTLLNTLSSNPKSSRSVFLQTAILSSLISWQFFSLFNDTDEWWHTIMSLKGPISINHSSF